MSRPIPGTTPLKVPGLSLRDPYVDPDAVELACAGEFRARRLTLLEREATVDRLTGYGKSANTIALTTGLSSRSVQRYRRKARRRACGEWVGGLDPAVEANRLKVRELVAAGVKDNTVIAARLGITERQAKRYRCGTGGRRGKRPDPVVEENRRRVAELVDAGVVKTNAAIAALLGLTAVQVKNYKYQVAKARAARRQTVQSEHLGSPRVHP